MDLTAALVEGACSLLPEGALSLAASLAEAERARLTSSTPIPTLRSDGGEACRTVLAYVLFKLHPPTVIVFVEPVQVKQSQAVTRLVDLPEKFAL